MDRELEIRARLVRTKKMGVVSAIYIINKVKHEIPYIALKTLYYSLFHSHITYGISVWGSSEFIKKITILQKKNHSFNTQ